MLRVRTRMTQRITRARLELEVRRSVEPLIYLALGFAVGIACFLYILGHIGGGYSNTRTLKFYVSNATGIVPGRSEVRFKNIPAGQVKAAEIKDDKTMLTVTVEKRFGPVYRDATAALRPNTPLQDMYLDVTGRGTPAAGPAGTEPLAIGQTDTSVGIGEVLNAFSPDVRAHLAQLLDQLGTGLNDHGQGLRATFEQLAPLIEVAGRLSHQLAVRGARTRRLVSNVAGLTQALGEHDEALRTIVESGNATLAATAGERANLDRTLALMPSTLEGLDRALISLHGVLPNVDSAVRALDPAATALPRGLTAVRSLSKALAPAVRSLRAPLTELVPLANDLRPVSRSLSTAARRLRPQIPAVAKTVTIAAGCPLGPYEFFQHTASLTKYEDSAGVVPRGDFGFGLDTVLGSKDPNVTASPSCAPGAPKGYAP